MKEGTDKMCKLTIYDLLALLIAIPVGFLLFSFLLGTGLECPMSDQGRNNTFEMLGFILNHFEEHNITYWLTSGTLLGAMREGDILNNEWEDLDFSIMDTEVPKLIASFENLEKKRRAKLALERRRRQSDNSLALEDSTPQKMEPWERYRLIRTELVQPKWRSMFMLIDAAFTMEETTYAYMEEIQDPIQAADIYVWKVSEEHPDQIERITVQERYKGPNYELEWYGSPPLRTVNLRGYQARVPHQAEKVLEREFGAGCIENVRRRPSSVFRCFRRKNWRLLTSPAAPLLSKVVSWSALLLFGAGAFFLARQILPIIGGFLQKRLCSWLKSKPLSKLRRSNPFV